MPRFIIITPSDDVRYSNDPEFERAAELDSECIIIDTAKNTAVYAGETIAVEPITFTDWEALDE